MVAAAAAASITTIEGDHQHHHYGSGNKVVIDYGNAHRLSLISTTFGQIIHPEKVRTPYLGCISGGVFMPPPREIQNVGRMPSGFGHDAGDEIDTPQRSVDGIEEMREDGGV